MKPRFRIALPPRGSSARLPALLVPLLAAMAIIQLALPGGIALPAAGVVANRSHEHSLASAPMIYVDPLLTARPLFTPIVAHPAGAAPPDPLGGAVIAGVVQQGRIRVAVVQTGGGHLRYVGAGGLIAGWRIAALGSSSASLAHGHDHLNVPYGAHATAPSTAVRSTSEDSQ